MFKRIAMLAVVLLWAGAAFAAHPLITDDAGTQGRGKAQLEINGEYGQDRAAGVTVRSNQIAASLSYGISAPLDVIIGVPYQRVRTTGNGEGTSESGVSDASLELKWRFYDRDGLSFALKPGISLPAGDNEKGLGAGRTTYHFFCVASKELKSWAFHLNFGLLRNENKNEERKNLLHTSLAATVEVIKDLKIVGNIGLERNTDRNENIDPAFILGGLIYSLSESFDIDFGIRGGLNKPETDFSILAGTAYRF